MSSRYTKDYLKQGLAAIGATVTDSAISEPFPITADGALHMLIGIKLSAITDTTGLTAKLQTSIDGGTTWQDSKTAALEATGWTFIRLMVEDADDQQYLPLGVTGRVVITTGADDAATVSAVRVVQDN